MVLDDRAPFPEFGTIPGENAAMVTATVDIASDCCAGKTAWTKLPFP